MKKLIIVTIPDDAVDARLLAIRYTKKNGKGKNVFWTQHYAVTEEIRIPTDKEIADIIYNNVSIDWSGGEPFIKDAYLAAVEIRRIILERR